MYATGISVYAGLVGVNAFGPMATVNIMNTVMGVPYTAAIVGVNMYYEVGSSVNVRSVFSPTRYTAVLTDRAGMVRAEDDLPVSGIDDYFINDDPIFVAGEGSNGSSEERGRNMSSRDSRFSGPSDKLRVGILFGGRSAEHEVSIMSARNVVGGADRDKYDLTLIGIDRKGEWYYDLPREFLFGTERVEASDGHDIGKYRIGAEEGGILHAAIGAAISAIDVLFPVLHGPYGEDGRLQGMFEVLDIPYVGAGVLGSAIGMDKDVMKRLLREAGIPTPKFLTISRSARGEFDFDTVVRQLGFPFFVKPSNLGSSVGINMVKGKKEYAAALAEAFGYGNKAVLEERIKGREIECSVIGNDVPRASLPGEILLGGNEYYSYGAKYHDDSTVKLGIPAQLPSDVVGKIQDYSVAVFKTLCCEGMARIDFFLDEGGAILVNEINTIPGFTNISMFPKLWEASGLAFSDLFDELIRLAIERYESANVLSVVR